MSSRDERSEEAMVVLMGMRSLGQSLVDLFIYYGLRRNVAVMGVDSFHRNSYRYLYLSMNIVTYVHIYVLLCVIVIIFLTEKISCAEL